jgi:hypothetical protein
MIEKAEHLLQPGNSVCEVPTKAATRSKRTDRISAGLYIQTLAIDEGLPWSSRRSSSFSKRIIRAALASVLLRSGRGFRRKTDFAGAERALIKNWSWQNRATTNPLSLMLISNSVSCD